MSLFDLTEVTKTMVWLTRGQQRHGNHPLGGTNCISLWNGHAQFWDMRTWNPLNGGRSIPEVLIEGLLFIFKLEVVDCFCDKQEKVFLPSAVSFQTLFLMLWLFLIGYCTKETCLQHTKSRQNVSEDLYSFRFKNILLQFFFSFLAVLRFFYSFKCTVSYLLWAIDW